MPFIQMIFTDIETQCLKHPHARDPQDGFLLQAVAIVAAVQIMRDQPIFRLILHQVGIQQDDGLSAARWRFQDVQPSADPDHAAEEFDGDHGPQAGRPLGRFPELGRLVLPSGGIDGLAKVAGPADETDRHHVHVQVGGRTQGVAGKDPQTARVGRNLAAQGDFHCQIPASHHFIHFHRRGD